MVGLSGNAGNLGVGCTEGAGRFWIGVIPAQKRLISSQRVEVEYRFDDLVSHKEAWFWKDDLALKVRSASVFTQGLMEHESLKIRIGGGSWMHFRLGGADKAIGRIFATCDSSEDRWPLS